MNYKKEVNQDDEEENKVSPKTSVNVDVGKDETKGVEMNDPLIKDKKDNIEIIAQPQQSQKESI